MTAAEEPPQEAPPLGSRRARSLVVVNTGDGKGKSTAAFGIVLRATAREWPVAVVQFLKSGKWQVGEEKACRELGVDWWSIGDGFTWDSEDLTEDEAVAAAAWSHTRSLIEDGGHRLVVLDEITYPINWGWVDVAEVVEVLRRRPDDVNVIVTGRDAPQAIVDLADTVTEMRKVKHAYDSGVMARRGIDY
jgi:cob(I)alamin adenosyltransferase